MEAELRSLSSLDDGQPEDPTDFWTVVQAEIGPRGESGADVFTFYVCTPEKLKRLLETDGYMFGARILFVKEFDWPVIERAIESLCQKVRGQDWEEVAAHLGRHAEWEFEGM